MRCVGVRCSPRTHAPRSHPPLPPCAYTCSEPRFDGGVPIVDYEVQYTRMMQLQVAGAALAADGGKAPQKAVLRVGSAVTRFVLAGLEGGQRHWDIAVRAINAVELTSAPSNAIEATTPRA